MKIVYVMVRWIAAVSLLAIGSIVAPDLDPARAQAGDGSIGAEWKGTFDWTARQPVPSGVQYFSGHLDMVLEEDESGKLQGKLTGNQLQKLETSCSVTADLAGTFAAPKVTITFANPTFAPPQVSPCPNGRLPGTGGPVYVFPQFNEALLGLTPVDKWHYQFDREWTFTVGRYPITLHYTVKLQRTGIFWRGMY